MNELKRFFQLYYKDSIELKKRFEITEKHHWTSLTVLNEIAVQIGHICCVVDNSKLLEKGRKIDDLGDEISDVFLQIFILIKISSFGDFKILNTKTTEDSLNELMVVFGQLSEALMEMSGVRFEKPRNGFNSIKEFIYYKINQMLQIMINFANTNHVDIFKAYKEMLINANSFLDEYEKRN